jgi:hypothetical protein
MASTRGRKPLPVPPSLHDGMSALGFQRIGDDSPARYRNPLHPELALSVVASNIPGDSSVIVEGMGGPARRLSPDAVLVDVVIELGKLRSPVRKVQ